MNKIITLILIIWLWADLNIIIAAEGRCFPSGKYFMPKFLRKIVFYLPRIFYKFTRRGIILSACSHILLALSALVLVISQEHLDEVSGILLCIWIIEVFGYSIVLGMVYLGLLPFGEKKFLKNYNAQTKDTEIVSFNGSDIITEAVVSKPDAGRKLLVMIPTVVPLDYKGTFTVESEDEYIGTCGNYNLVSDILVAEGYTTVRFNINQKETDGFFDYTKDLKRKIKDIIDKEGYNRISIFAHGPIGSVTALEIIEEFKVDRMIMFGGGNVTPYDDLTGVVRFRRVKKSIDDKFVEQQNNFGKEILSIKADMVMDKLKKIDFPTLVIFGAEELVYNSNLVEKLEVMDNKRICVKKFLNITGIGIVTDLANCPTRTLEVKKNLQFNVSNELKKTIKEWAE